MSQHESFEEWRDRTKPSAEFMALATGARLPIYLVVALFIVLVGGFEPPQAMVLLAVLAVFYVSGALKRHWIREGAKLDDPRIRVAHWVPLVAGRCGTVLLAWGDTSELLVLAGFLAFSIADVLWHPQRRLRWRHVRGKTEAN